MLYSAFTSFTGFEVNSGEYKMMGLAPYGRPVYVSKIIENIIDLKPDGTFQLNMDFFDYCVGNKMTSDRFNKLFDGPPRKTGSPITQREMDLARSIQQVTEEIILRLAKTLREQTGAEASTCLAGGVALNCVANGRLRQEGPFKEIWIQPAAGDSGAALGCAFSVWHQYFNKKREGRRKMATLKP